MDPKLSNTFISLVKMGIGHHIDALSEGVDWQAVQELATKQGLYAVVLDGIEKLPTSSRPPQELLLEWIGEILQGYEYQYVQYTKAISGLAGFYNSHGYKMMVLKGYACSLNWPKPEHRPCGDIDIWQFGKQKEADAFLVKAKGIKIDRSHHHHTVFNWGDFIVENHYDFVNVYAHRSSAELEKVFKERGADDSNTIELYGHKVYLPSPNLHALFLIKHNASHFVGSNITLRQVLDWAFFVEKHNQEIDWDWLNSMIVEFHLKDFVDCINAICVEKLGFDANMFSQVRFNLYLKDKIFNDIMNPKYTAEEPKYLIPRLIYKYWRWKGNGWKQELCYNEKRWSSFLTSLWSKVLKPASF